MTGYRRWGNVLPMSGYVSSNLYLSKRDRQFLNVAAKAAENSEAKNMHGAVLVKGGRVLAIAVNKNRSHPTAFDNHDDIRAHAALCAERAALARVADATGAVMYVARVLRKNGQTSLSKPCSRCEKAMIAAGVKRVVWTT